MKYILIENKGEMDVNALTLLGGSTKRDDATKVGFFGSGAKYTLALLLKNNIDFKIYSGLNEIKIETKEVAFRDKVFQRICINGLETSLTTDMGPDWELFMSIRELLANSMDEGESNVVLSTDVLNAKEGYTRIYIEHVPGILEVIEKWDQYFSFDRTDALVEVGNNKIFPVLPGLGETFLLYRKGFRCYFNQRKSFFSYDLESFEINESRVISSTYSMDHQITSFLTEHASVEICTTLLKDMCTQKTKSYEYFLDWYYYNSYKLNSNWKTAIGNRVLIVDAVSGFYEQEANLFEFYYVPLSLAKTIAKCFPEIKVFGLSDPDKSSDYLFKSIKETTKKQKFLLSECERFFKEVQIPVFNYPVEVVKFNSNQIFGLAKDGTIYISEELFDKGKKELCTVLLEEFVHLDTKLKDETRELQTYLFTKWVSSLEEQHGYFL